MDGILVIDKPEGLTSHDIVSIVRRVTKTRKVGHAGTLDPFATGVLVVGVNQGTKLLQFLQGDEKEYEATVRLGVETDTLDRDGKVVSEIPCPDVNYEEMKKILVERGIALRRGVSTEKELEEGLEKFKKWKAK